MNDPRTETVPIDWSGCVLPPRPFRTSKALAHRFEMSPKRVFTQVRKFGGLRCFAYTIESSRTQAN